MGKSKDKRKAVDEVDEAVITKKKHKTGHDSMIEDIKRTVESLKEDVEGIKIGINSILARLDSSKARTEVTWSPSSSDDSSTDEYYQRDALLASGLNPVIDKAAIDDFFQAVGPIVEVEFGKDENDEFDESAIIRFASADEATEALKLKGNSCRGYPMFLRHATNGLYTTYVSGFDATLPENEIKLQLVEHFSSIGDVKGIYLPKDKITGALSGGAYINMIDDSAKVARLNLSIMKGRKLYVETTDLRKAGKKEMKKNRVDPPMKPKNNKTIFVYSDDE